MKLKLDLHDIYNRGADIDRALRDIIDEAIRTRAPLVEIIPGKGSGQLKKRVLRFLDQKEIKRCTTGSRRTPGTSAGCSSTSGTDPAGAGPSARCPATTCGHARERPGDPAGRARISA